MRPLTNDRPKPLIEVRGKALIDHAIDRLVQAGVTMIVVNAYYHADKLKEHLAKRRDVEIQISEEGEVLLGTGGGIFKVLSKFGGEPFFVHNSDSIWVEGCGRALDRLKARWRDWLPLERTAWEVQFQVLILAALRAAWLDHGGCLRDLGFTWEDFQRRARRATIGFLDGLRSAGCPRQATLATA